MKEFKLDEIQADAILDTRLYQLARLEIEKIREEQRDKQKRADEIEGLLKSKKARWKLVETELEEVAQQVRRQAPHRAQRRQPSWYTTPRPTSCTRTPRSWSRATAGSNGSAR